MTEDAARAESLLIEALEADLFNGNAHNNLGVLHLERGELYEAATRFEMARKLMPDHPDPRLNLAITYERAGRIEEAMRSYEGALACAPGHLPTLKARARCQVRHGRVDETTAGSLREIALRGDATWRAWAQAWLLKIESGS
jgi:Flp pilus assembly protein TadD